MHLIQAEGRGRERGRGGREGGRGGRGWREGRGGEGREGGMTDCYRYVQ